MFHCFTANSTENKPGKFVVVILTLGEKYMIWHNNAINVNVNVN